MTAERTYAVSGCGEFPCDMLRRDCNYGTCKHKRWTENHLLQR